jgi:hypothetical protein
VDTREGYARVSKAQSKGRLNKQTKVAKVRDVRLNDLALHALELLKPHTYTPGGCIFRSPRYDADFKTEKSQREIFTRIKKRSACATDRSTTRDTLTRNWREAKLYAHNLLIFQ